MTVLLSWIIAGLGALCLYLLSAASYHRYRHKKAAELAADRKTALLECNQLCHDTMNQLRAMQAEKVGSDNSPSLPPLPPKENAAGSSTP